MSQERGFSTLEVIAAVAIVAVALVPIATLQTRLARSQVRLAESQAESTALHNSTALLRDINPMETPSGHRPLGNGATLTWTSAAVSPPRPSVNPTGFEVQLYRIEATIEGRNETSTFQFELVGWRRLSDDNSAPAMD